MLTIFLLDEHTPATAQDDKEDAAEDDEGDSDEEYDDDDDDGGVRICSKTGFRYMVLEPGLSEVAYQLAVDTTNRLALVADTHRIKSFSWGGDVTFGGWTPPRGENVHTMNSKKYDGPIAVLSGGRIVRAGKGGAAIWSLDTLETHQGGRRVGCGEFEAEDSWRDDYGGEIERSTGSAPSTTVKFTQTGLTPAGWHLHTPSGHLLCAENSHRSDKYGCYALDLEAGGKTASRFLGHGGNVTAFSTSTGDANVFLTACADGYARLYDVRHPLPAMTIDSGKSSEFCEAVTLVHPDGIPSMSLRHAVLVATLADDHRPYSRFHRWRSFSEHQDVGHPRPRARVRALDGEHRGAHIDLGRAPHDAVRGDGVRLHGPPWENV